MKLSTGEGTQLSCAHRETGLHLVATATTGDVSAAATQVVKGFEF